MREIRQKETYAIVEKAAAYMRELAEKTPYITIADWNQVAKEHPEIWTGTDQVHLEVTIVRLKQELNCMQIPLPQPCKQLKTSQSNQNNVYLKEKSWRKEV